MNLFSGEKLVSIDWFTCTGSNIKYNYDGYPSLDGVNYIEKLLELLKVNHNYNWYELKRGGRYKRCIDVDEGIKLFLCGPLNKYGLETWKLEITGKGCDRFDDKSWLELFLYVNSSDINVTRIDMPCDEVNILTYTQKELLDILEVYKNVKLRKGSNYIKIVHSKSLKDPNEYKGYTFYIGSPSSNLFLRIYDKYSEQKDKSLAFLDQYFEWLRYELVFKDEKAQDLFVDIIEKLLNKESLGSLWGLYMKEVFTICTLESCKDLNKSRWIIDPKYSDFIGGFEKQPFKRKKNKTSELQKSKDWIEKQASKALLKLYISKGKKFFDIWIKNIMFDRLNELDDNDINEINTIRKYFLQDEFEKDELINITDELKLDNDEYDYLRNLPYGWPSRKE